MSSDLRQSKRYDTDSVRNLWNSCAFALTLAEPRRQGRWECCLLKHNLYVLQLLELICHQKKKGSWGQKQLVHLYRRVILCLAMWWWLFNSKGWAPVAVFVLCGHTYSSHCFRSRGSGSKARKGEKTYTDWEGRNYTIYTPKRCCTCGKSKESTSHEIY